MNNPKPKDLISQLSAQGLREFQNGHYTKALKIFSKAITSILDQHRASKAQGKGKYHSGYSSLLDYRAACYEKLNKLSYVLIDSERLIELYPYNCKGYLRTAKIHKLMNEPKKSYNVLTSGLEKLRSGKKKYGSKLPINDTLYSKMKADRQSLMKSLQISKTAVTHKNVPTSNTDPVQRLPLEIVMSFFAMLDQKSILRSLLVSKLWYRTITSLPQISEQLSLKNSISLKEFDLFLSFFKKVNSGRKTKLIRNVSLRPKPADEPSIVKRFFTQDMTVQKLTLLLRNVSSANMDKLLARDTNTRKIYRSMIDLSLQISIVNSRRGINYILNHCNSLQRLTLLVYGIANNSAVEPLDFQTTFTSLKSLSIYFRPTDLGSSNASFMSSMLQYNSFENLSELSLSNCNVNPDILASLFEKSDESLKALKLDGIPNVTLEWLLAVLQNRKCRLSSLEVKETGTTAPQHFRSAQYDQAFPLLSELRALILNNTTISFEGLMKLIRATKGNLVHLQLIANLFLVFKKSVFDSRQSGGLFDFAEFIQSCPQLRNLGFIQCPNLTDYSLKILSKELVAQARPQQLSYLDISSNAITGVGILELFQAPKCWLRLMKLKINGCNVHPETVKLLTQKGYCNEVEYRVSA
ncbi:unnamed protein product [Ambrosiozyma monospora]|uniref:Unnamed protein product n=1 Tax=Ambrosiozyma monospora TaxID=43982 RepID=A0ACB5T0R1_AMBMO|nr:unnamed protein product [Ambrosiozyma monospora]